MDWIERWLDVSPDNGDGSIEALVFVVLVVGFWCLWVSVRGKLPARVRILRRELDLQDGETERAGSLTCQTMQSDPSRATWTWKEPYEEGS